MNTRFGYDGTRDLLYIRQQVIGPMAHSAVPRCGTCGRAELCCCGRDCPCLVTKER